VIVIVLELELDWNRNCYCNCYCNCYYNYNYNYKSNFKQMSKAIRLYRLILKEHKQRYSLIIDVDKNNNNNNNNNKYLNLYLCSYHNFYY